MSNEKIKILEMVQNGTITATEGLELLKAIEDNDIKAVNPSNISGRFIRIRVSSGQHTKVNVNVPLSLLKVATKLADVGLKFIPEEARLEMEKKGINLQGINFEELVQLIDEGLVDGKLVDVDTDDPKEGRTKVEIYVE
ncbi:hypothetical protein Dtox_2519 [Desulfofarcimen acetoxidans DSM 771]|jgi:hypothetical protein|uniref:YvlB/LiaX N-terminal domain-containing protein n=1 Tax=Desulfofarcimen acetoxidans (strain ATCC 49208 / DSM 771 / KCTC 5769 / VKM B-1644 / 5575) TaxID=485916 RepID=C8W0R8_DESAS|nr:hypothetical protein [Desulfofarcimen acetoxidans]ACV63323.1 hypothetical protein Dtox_2519 [Desulfofarcimen acetoxidans DSM 771]